MKSMTISLDQFSLKVTSIVPESLCCLLCANVLDNPQQGQCGCRFCLVCINDYLKYNARVCPGQTEDCIEVMLNIERDLRPDVLAKREINKIIVKCPFPSCHEECELRIMRDHVSVCSTSIVPCWVCNEDVTRADFENHTANECCEGMTSCRFCQANMTRKQLKEMHHNYGHSDLCLEYADYCPSECGESGIVLWVDHRRMCTKRLVTCPYNSIGCTSIGAVLGDMPQHMLDYGFEHAEELLKHVDNLNNEIAQLNNTMKTVTEETSGVAKKYVDLQSKEIQQQNDQIAALTNMLREIKKENSRIALQIRNQIKTEVASSLRDTNDVMERMNCEMMRMRSEIDSVKSTPEPVKEIINNKVTSNDVALSWVIYNFTKVNNLISPKFYTDPNGYKMDLCLEKSKKGYVSIYARLRCGEYDSDLSWPFRKQVTVTIVDQEKMDRDYFRVILFNEKAGSACDRKYGLNTGDFGFSKFISYEVLRDKPYLSKDNRIVITCSVTDIFPS